MTGDDATREMLAGYRQGAAPLAVCPTCGSEVPAAKLATRVTENAASEALIGGKRSAGDIREMLRAALRERAQMAAGADYVYVYVVDHTDTDVVYCAGEDCLWQCSYTITGDEVTLGEPARVVPAYVPAPAAEATAEGVAELDRHAGRVLEALGTDEATGGRIYRVQVIAYGESKNGRRYPAKVMRQCASLYEGAKAYDHHRTEQELSTGTIAGMVGHYRNVKATSTGIEADLHLLPSATHAAEALDAALALGGTDPLVGISHDVQAVFKPVVTEGRALFEAVQIVRVLSADIVSDPAAGGAAIRAVAGGINPDDSAGTVPAGETEEPDVPLTKADLLAALRDVSSEDLAAVGLAKAGETTEPTPPAPDPAPRVAETQTYAKGTALGTLAVKALAEAAELEPRAVEALLPDRFGEDSIAAAISSAKALLAAVERKDLKPTATAQVTQESLDKKKAALDGMFDHTGRTPGYRSFKEAWADITGARVLAWGEDINRRIIAESLGTGYDSHNRVGNGAELRGTESLDTSSWPQVLGDSITRRAIALYSTPSLQSWRKVVSAMPPVSDFREQKRERVGGYGVLPTVNQGAPYQPLTSPTDEEAVYSVIKRGGTEDLTWEMIVNDDIGKVQMIPRNLGLAAAITLYRFVWDIVVTNAATSYDATALFHADHGNTATSAALSQTTLTAGRVAMRSQAAYGHSVNILSTVPKLLVVPNELEEIAFQLSRSAVAVPSTAAGPSDTPNLHAGLDVEVIDYWTDANDWFLFGDPLMVPLIEVGFLFGNQEPELWTQADPTQGSVFNADKVTYKIRHVYSGTPLDHRGMYRGQG